MDIVDGLIPVWPIDENGDERVWAFVASRMAEEIAAGNLTVGGYNQRRKSWAMKVRRVKKQEARLKERTVWWDSRYDIGANGTTLLTALLGRAGAFPFPKSLYTMTDLIAVCTVNRPDAVIVDFFAGSGTTMHATAYLNSLDNGRRRSIMVTNNEVGVKLQPSLRKKGLKPGDPEWEKFGIFQQATLPRCVAAVTGTRPSGEAVPDKYRYKNGQLMSAGLAENVEFFTLTYEDPDHVRLGAEFAAVAPMLWLMAGAEGPRIDKITGTWAVPEDGRYGVLFDADAWPAFVEGLRSNAVATHAFIVTDSDAVFQRVVADLPATITSVRLYESYLRSFAINTGGWS
jgi:adenine-specific DNA-methyltransferase